MQSFDFDHVWWRLFQKRFMRPKLNIYVFIELQYFFSSMLSYKNLKLKFIEIINEKHNSNLINCENKQVHNVYHWALLSTLSIP